MKTYSGEDLKRYLQNDWILKTITEQSARGGGPLVLSQKMVPTDRWLLEMDNKRMIYADLYGDILRGEQRGCRVLDIGGGYNSLTKVLAENCEYYLLDFLAHGGKTEIMDDKINWINGDWFESENDGCYDIVISNDLFPDVDQRLELFLDKYLPLCKELRLLVTYYNNPRFYTTRRVDDAEIMTFLSWDGEITALKLQKYRKYIQNYCEDALCNMSTDRNSVYWNGRQVTYIRFDGLAGRCE